VPTLVEKTILVNSKVQDLWGLFMDLRRADFKVRNVGMDPRGTYIHLELDEEKDPTPIVEAWVGKAPAKSSLLVKEIRQKELEKVKEEEHIRLEAQIEAERKAEAARLKSQEMVVNGSPVEVAPVKEAEAQEKIGILKRIFRKFF
jgi:hypothetical protein